MSNLRQRHEMGYTQLAKLVHLVQKSSGSKPLARLAFIRRGIHLWGDFHLELRTSASPDQVLKVVM